MNKQNLNQRNHRFSSLNNKIIRLRDNQPLKAGCLCFHLIVIIIVINLISARNIRRFYKHITPENQTFSYCPSFCRNTAKLSK